MSDEQNVPSLMGAAVESTASPQYRIVGVALDDGKVADFDPMDMNLSIGDWVVVDNDRDLNLGRVVFIGENKDRKTLRKIERRIGSEDMLLIRRNKRREEEAFVFCCKKIVERDLSMKLVRVAYLHGGNKAIFYFTADGRVDFRALVRDLAQQLHVRIEMRQIGVRDEAKMLGSIGVCGQHICCSRFLRKFVPVSIKMAKNQNLALNPQKLSGICGRLMCCLVYEDACYREMKKGLPKPGDVIDTPEGRGKVIELEVLARKIRVQVEQKVVTIEVDKLDNSFRVIDDQGEAEETDDFEDLEKTPELKKLLDEQPPVEPEREQPEKNSKPAQVPPFSITRPFKEKRESNSSDQGLKPAENESPKDQGDDRSKRPRPKRRARRKPRQRRKAPGENAPSPNGRSDQGPRNTK